MSRLCDRSSEPPSPSKFSTAARSEGLLTPDEFDMPAAASESGRRRRLPDPKGLARPVLRSLNLIELRPYLGWRGRSGGVPNGLHCTPTKVMAV